MSLLDHLWLRYICSAIRFGRQDVCRRQTSWLRNAQGATWEHVWAYRKLFGVHLSTFFFTWPNSHYWARAASLSRLQNHRHTTLGSSPLDQLSARRTFRLVISFQVMPTFELNCIAKKRGRNDNGGVGGDQWLQWRTEGRGFGGSIPPRNSEDIGGVLDRMSKKNRRLDFVL